MIKSVTVTNYLGESMTMELEYPEKSGFLIRSISGLGPSKANINTTELSTADGSLYNSSRVTSRNIVMDLVFLEHPTIEKTRQLSYKYFPIKKQVKLTIETLLRTCEIYGFVETNEPTIFSKEVSTRISIVCPDPYFYSAYSNVTVFAGIEPMFEFPFSNESLTDNVMMMGDIILGQEKSVYYNGDAEVGIVINIHALGPATNITIYNTLTRQTMYIDHDKLVALTGSGLEAGEDIIITTVSGYKSVLLLRNGVYINILNCLSRNSSWFLIAKGDNMFAFTAETGATNLEFKITNQIVYEGV